jgi:hypothetical protein
MKGGSEVELLTILSGCVTSILFIILAARTGKRKYMWFSVTVLLATSFYTVTKL